MGEKILGWIEKIVTGEKRRWFFASVIIIAILMIIVYPQIDANFLYYNRIEKRIDNLSRLVELTEMPLDENHVLYEEYISIIDELETARENSLFNAEKEEDSKQDKLWKFGGGAVLWWTVAIIMLFQKKKGERRTFKELINNIAATILCLGIGCLLGTIFLYAPTVISSKINCGLAIVIQLVVLWLLLEGSKPKK